MLLTSNDGDSWEVRTTPLGGGVAFLDNTFLLFSGSSILQSTPVGATVLRAASNPINGNFEVSVSGGQIGATYQLQSCTNLSTKIWSDVTPFVQTQTVTVVPVPGGFGEPQCYYRALTTP